MKRFTNFINEFFFKPLEKEGYLYIADDNYFVQDELIATLEEIEIYLKGNKSIHRRKILEEFLSAVRNHEVLEGELEKRERLIILIEYQMFLDEKGYDNRFKKVLRELTTTYLLKEYPALKVLRERYFYFPRRIEINFIDNIGDLIYQIKKEQNQNYNFFYRGHSNLQWSLLPAIYRNNWIDNEHNMFREIILRNSEEFSKTKSAFEKLTIMQHYGLPTRLLDITKNPLVALFFACCDNTQYDNPGELIVFNPAPDIIKYYDSDTVSILSNFAKAERNLKFIKNKKTFNVDLTGIKLLHLIKEEKPYFLAEIEPLDLSKTLIVKPINNNERIKRQLGYFFLFGFNNEINKPADINSIFERNKLIPKYFIEENKKKSILTELEALGISSNMLFPEIDKGTEHLKSKY